MTTYKDGLPPVSTTVTAGSTGITHDDAVNNLRAARAGIEEHMNRLSADAVLTREIIRRRDERIQELLDVNDKLEQSGDTQLLRDYAKLEALVAKNVDTYAAELKKKDAENQKLKIMHSEVVYQAHEALDEAENLRELNNSMLVAYGNLIEQDKARCQPHTMGSQFADWMQENLTPVNAKAKEMLRPEGWRVLSTGKSDMMYKEAANRRMKNVTRLASAAISHLNGVSPLNTSGVANAIDLLKPLAGGQHDTYGYDGDTQACGEQRPEHDDSDFDLSGSCPVKGWEDGQQ